MKKAIAISGGNFLFAAEIVRAVRISPAKMGWALAELNKILEGKELLPGNIASYFQLFMNRMTSFSQKKVLWEVFVAVMDIGFSIKFSELQYAVQLTDPGTQPSSIRAMLDAIKPFTKETDGYICLYHRSFRDWLLARPLGAKQFVDRVAGHRRMAAVGLLLSSRAQSGRDTSYLESIARVLLDGVRPTIEVNDRLAPPQCEAGHYSLSHADRLMAHLHFGDVPLSKWEKIGFTIFAVSCPSDPLSFVESLIHSNDHSRVDELLPFWRRIGFGISAVCAKMVQYGRIKMIDSIWSALSSADQLDTLYHAPDVRTLRHLIKVNATAINGWIPHISSFTTVAAITHAVNELKYKCNIASVRMHRVKDLSVLRWLLDQNKKLVDLKDTDGNTPLFRMLDDKRGLVLIACNANVNARNDRNESILMKLSADHGLVCDKILEKAEVTSDSLAEVWAVNKSLAERMRAGRWAKVSVDVKNIKDQKVRCNRCARDCCFWLDVLFLLNSSNAGFTKAGCENYGSCQ